MMVRVVTDSNTMVPPALVESLGITVVPLTVTIAGEELVEDHTMDVAAAYQRLRAGEAATTSAPSPGLFAATYRALGDGPVVSVHIGAAYSGTLNSARLGASLTDADVHFVDTGTASFLAGCCVLAAAEMARSGADPPTVVAAAESVAAEVASVFTVAELDRARSGGRLDPADRNGVPVLRMDHSGIVPVGHARTANEAADLMVQEVSGSTERLRIGVGDADAGILVGDLVARLRAARPSDDVIRYVVGPTVAAHAGMGTFGIVYHSLTTYRRDLTGRLV